jgi:hypothetical protein
MTTDTHDLGSDGFSPDERQAFEELLDEMSRSMRELMTSERIVKLEPVFCLFCSIEQHGHRMGATLSNVPAATLMQMLGAQMRAVQARMQDEDEDQEQQPLH